MADDVVMAPRAVIFSKGTSKVQTGRLLAFAEGLRRHGWKAKDMGCDRSTPTFPAADLLVVYGLNQARALRHYKGLTEIVVLEHGFFGDRGRKWFMVGFGGELTGKAKYRLNWEPTEDRFLQHHGHLLKPWSINHGGYDLLIGQKPGDRVLRDVPTRSLTPWLNQVASELREQGREFYFRPHPHRYARPEFKGGSEWELPMLPEGTSLADAFAGARRVVTWSSNTACESVLAGIPTVAYDEHSPAWDVTARSIQMSDYTSYRTNWCAETAWKQFTTEEMASGFCWEAVGW